MPAIHQCSHDQPASPCYAYSNIPLTRLHEPTIMLAPDQPANFLFSVHDKRDCPTRSLTCLLRGHRPGWNQRHAGAFTTAAPMHNCSIQQSHRLPHQSQVVMQHHMLTRQNMKVSVLHLQFTTTCGEDQMSNLQLSSLFHNLNWYIACRHTKAGVPEPWLLSLPSMLISMGSLVARPPIPPDPQISVGTLLFMLHAMIALAQSSQHQPADHVSYRHPKLALKPHSTSQHDSNSNESCVPLSAVLRPHVIGSPRRYILPMSLGKCSTRSKASDGSTT